LSHYEACKEYSVGNRTYLTFGRYCQFDANNCLPVTWLPLFDKSDFVVETEYEDSEEYEVAKFQTSQSFALERVYQAIDKLSKYAVWEFLRPLEILRDELTHCSPDEGIELDVTQLWAMNEIFNHEVVHGAEAFSEMVQGLTGEEKQDVANLTELINKFSVGSISSIADLDALERMFVLFGTFEGVEEKEDLYSLEYFDQYWSRV